MTGKMGWGDFQTKGEGEKRTLQERLEAPMKFEFKPQGRPAFENGGNVCLGVPYVSTAEVRRRLDEVFGPLGWRPVFTVIDERERPGRKQGETVFITSVECSIEVKDPEQPGEWIAKGDIGFGRGQTPEEARKSAWSDAEKRAAGQFGIGRFLEEIPREWFPCIVNQGGSFVRWANPPKQTEPRGAGGNGPPAPKTQPQTDEEWREAVLQSFAAIGQNGLESFFGPAFEWNRENDRKKFLRLHQLMNDPDNPLEFPSAAEQVIEEFSEPHYEEAFE